MYQQGVVGPSAPPVQGPPTMTLPIGDVRNFYYELGDAGTDMENLASELRIAIEADVAQQVADKVAEEMKVFQEEAKKNAKSKKFDSVVATAIIQMLKSENEGHKLRLEGERKVLEEVKAAREDLQASLAQSTAQVEAEKTRADQAEEANKAAAVALEEAKRPPLLLWRKQTMRQMQRWKHLSSKHDRRKSSRAVLRRNNSRRCRQSWTNSLRCNRRLCRNRCTSSSD